MIEIKPFKALRPDPKFVSVVNSPPYDVVSRDEAAEVIQRNPDSFLKIIKPEAAVSAKSVSSSYSDLAQRASMNLKELVDRKVMTAEQEPSLYIYQQSDGSYQRTGIVTCLSVDDYQNGLIKQHEKIRINTWQQRVQHILQTRTHTGCALVIYRNHSSIEGLVKQAMEIQNQIYDFFSDDGIRNICWKINQPDFIGDFIRAFKKIENLYIADGHHRVAAAAEVARIEGEKEKPGESTDREYTYFPAVLVGHHQIRILGYHRLIKDILEFSPHSFLAKLDSKFQIEKLPSDTMSFIPLRKYEFGMNLEGQWYRLLLKPEEIRKNKTIINCLDVSILQNLILEPLLGIYDSQKSKKIEFIGGNQALVKLEEKFTQGANVVFTLYPTSIDEVMQVSDHGGIMPPKSTWFEPKIRSGVFVHQF